ncbi:hypothetical protein QA601_12920 [Chitinispirillales bacterium ANBcel5]|uniref:hypothetical protein n=1 Tax=Cellulosispirillum alkaliphilum TaxID=3039283 RepID=UPI002A54C83F|nr:hypothetical protein [Chitinispirillales bacterium ANBcel5]
MMRKTAIAISIFLALQYVGASTLDHYAQFFTGITLLENNPFLTEQQRIQGFRDLEKVSGVDGAEASAFLKEVRDDPKQWQSVQEKMLELMDKYRNGKTETGK